MSLLTYNMNCGHHHWRANLHCAISVVSLNISKKTAKNCHCFLQAVIFWNTIRNKLKTPCNNQANFIFTQKALYKIAIDCVTIIIPLIHKMVFSFLHQNEKKSNKKLSTASTASLSTATTTSSVSIKDNLIDNKEKLNDLNDQILNSQQLSQPNFSRHHHHHVLRNNSTSTDRRNSSCSQDFRNNFNPSHHKSESIMSSDSDIRFTRKKLGDNQRCGCLLIAGFLVMLLIAGLVLYAGCEYNFLIQLWLLITIV